ncbi:5-hydroxyisourate hydrolase precursor [Anatilimnocola aggregata]|uniref:5-hydroxyisourate hydrolase n=1 Tax=Anatilimnocola aggregata TaxID=2528021 RepID=A0A517YDR5_9BACT|nr:hydroxyisourate hydrolase [Anatilimnocola aggregata]QDU28282.1 5-hydroxyisourate hydrolase precursor [Anatilimnocola aggregata]
MTANSPITTHILDVSRGKPAAGVAVRLELWENTGQWQLCGTGTTNDDGRVVNLLDRASMVQGRYRLTFDTGNYYAELQASTFYPQVTVEFIVTATSEHYHVPLLLSPFGYSTYRGS